MPATLAGLIPVAELTAATVLIPAAELIPATALKPAAMLMARVVPTGRTARRPASEFPGAVCCFRPGSGAAARMRMTPARQSRPTLLDRRCREPGPG